MESAKRQKTESEDSSAFTKIESENAIEIEVQKFTVNTEFFRSLITLPCERLLINDSNTLFVASRQMKLMEVWKVSKSVYNPPRCAYVCDLFVSILLAHDEHTLSTINRA